MTSLIDTARRLVQLGEAAQHGPWHAECCNSGPDCWCRTITTKAGSDDLDHCVATSGCLGKADAEYIAAARDADRLAAALLEAAPLLEQAMVDGRGDGPTMLSWIIAGGESGPNARPMHPDWARSLRDQAERAGVAFLFKQWGEWHPDPVQAPTTVICPDGEVLPVGRPLDRAEVTDAEVMFRVGKTNAGRVLDGRTWDGVPGVVL